MHLRSYSRAALRQWQIYRGLNFPRHVQCPQSARYFQTTSRALVIKPFLLADIGEGGLLAFMG